MNVNELITKYNTLQSILLFAQCRNNIQYSTNGKVMVAFHQQKLK